MLDPTRALALLAGVWGGRRPAADVSDAVALLLDPLGRREVLRSGGDVAGWRADDGGVVAAPGSLLGADGRLAEVRFWWCRGAEAREVVVGFAPDGSVTVGGGRVARREGVAP
ncbi:hypothetical protein G7085_06955 [Tessaracoccus sp. HDW20]|uniref:hypothetical protein n=1 Tax=Tessaracoccus coleopterorum TaxID=2714950 RepID=UPI0018D440E8|nr:hypothetical protein [Tessaracoccus coleopterorum]NHB84432.1 hypothetical protein [Tessaracoccus coleopterorum]